MVQAAGAGESGLVVRRLLLPGRDVSPSDAPNFTSFAAAARAGNPDSIVAFNPGVQNPIITLTPEEDYTAGEINEPDKVVCGGRWVGQAQFHMLSYLGPSWCRKPPRFTAAQVVAITKESRISGGGDLGRAASRRQWPYPGRVPRATEGDWGFSKAGEIGHNAGVAELAPDPLDGQAQNS